MNNKYDFNVTIDGNDVVDMEITKHEATKEQIGNMSTSITTFLKNIEDACKDQKSKSTTKKDN